MRAFAVGFAINRSTLLLAGIALASVSAALPSTALTLGNVAAQSGLGQSLRLEIPVSLGKDEVANASCLRLLADAAPGDAPQLVTGRVSFERGTPTSRIVVTTARPINEPALRVSVQSGCGNTTRRDYVLLFDLPAVSDVPPLEPVAFGEGASTAPMVPTIVGVPAHSANRDAARPAPLKATVAQAVMPGARDERAARAPSEPAATSPRMQSLPAIAVVASAPAGQSEMVIENAPAPAPARLAARTPSLRIVTMTANASGGGFISTASAQPLQPAASVRVEQQSPAIERLWPYAAVALCLAGLGMCAFAVRKQRTSQSPSWMVAAKAASKISPDTHASLNTFALFSEMAEPAPAAPRDDVEKRDAKPAPTAPGADLDTLLGDDLIDEKKIREAWAAAASEHAIDIGTDSILQAIATAEREMRLSPPPPAQVAMDAALDELLRKPKKR